MYSYSIVTIFNKKINSVCYRSFGFKFIDKAQGHLADKYYMYVFVAFITIIIDT